MDAPRVGIGHPRAMPSVLDLPNTVAETQHILAAVITPALLISACGSMLLSSSNRFGRVVDRVRALHAELDRDRPEPDEPRFRLRRRELRHEELGRLSQRALLLQRAMARIHLAIGLFVGTGFVLGLVQLFEGRLSWVPVLLEMGGAISMLASSVAFVREARLAGISTQKELELVEAEMRERRDS